MPLTCVDAGKQSRTRSLPSWMCACICSRTNYCSTVLTVQIDSVLGRDLFSHGGWILGRVRPYGKIFQHLRDLLERETALNTVQSIVLQPHGQGPIRWQLLGCDRAFSVLGAVVKQVESLHGGTVSRREEDLLPSSQQAPRLVCVGEEHLPVPDRDDVLRYRVRIRVRQV